MKRHMNRLMEVAVTGLALAALLAAPGCKKKAAEPKVASAPKNAAVSPGRSTVPDNAVALVDETYITREQLQAEMERLAGPVALSAAQKDDLRRRALKGLVETQLIVTGAMWEEIDAPQEQVDAAMAKVIQQQGGEEKLKEFLDPERLTAEQHLERIRISVLRDKLRQRFFPDPVSDDQVAAYYERYKKGRNQGVKLDVSRVLLKVPEDAGEEAWQAAEDKTVAVKAEIEAGLSFAEAARKYSQGPYARLGGDMGAVTRQRLPARTFAPAFDLAVGEMGGPYRVENGVQLLQVTGIDDQTVGSLAEEKEKMRHILESQRKVKNTGKLLDKLKGEYRVEVY